MISFLGLVKHIPQQSIREFILPRLYYWFHFNPNFLILFLTNRCNTACPFCPRTVMGMKEGVDMAKDIFYKSVNETYALGIKRVYLTGAGEPLVHPDINEFIGYLKEKGLFVSISTNAQFLDRHFEALSSIDLIKFSIEGWDKDSYEYYRKNCSFEKVKKNLSEFKEYLSKKREKPKTFISLLVNKETNVAQFFKIWQDKVDKVHFNCADKVFNWNNEKISFISFKEKRLKDNIFTFISKNKAIYCAHPFEDITISPEGNVLICCGDFTDSIVYGNIKNKSLADILDSEKRRQVQRQFISQKFNVCNGCPQFLELDEQSKVEFHSKIKDFWPMNTG